MPPEAVFYDLNRVFAPILRFKKFVKYTGGFDINHKAVHFRAGGTRSCIYYLCDINGLRRR
jgi:hypothetical protein